MNLKVALNVAEKPSVAKAVSQILGSTSNRIQSYSKFNPVYQFKMNIPGAPDYLMRFTSVAGHILNYKFPNQLNNWQTTDMLKLYSTPVYKTPTITGQNLIPNLEYLSKNVDVLILWLDCDMEGQAIAYDVKGICQRAATKQLEILRAKFSALTRQDITRSILNLDVPNPYLNDAVQLRQQLDLRIGASLTRFQTLKFGRLFQLNKGGFLSYGPCQFPTLGFVVERHQEIQKFKPQPFWTLKVIYQTQSENGTVEKAKFQWQRGRLFDKVSCIAIYESVLDNSQAYVSKVQKNRRFRSRPRPMNTIEFQKLATRVLHINSSKAMEIAQRLYQRGFISYPRTQTNIYNPTINLRNLVNNLKGSQSFGNFAEMVSNGIMWGGPKNGKSDDKAHPPIHPVKLVQQGQIQPQDWRVYNLIARHFLASLSKDAIGSETSIEIQIDKQVFSTKGIQVIESNFLQVYTFEKWSDNTVPDLKMRETFMPNQILMNQGSTKPPDYLTQAELITKMDKNGIGTDATIHEHIKTIQDREYALKVGNCFRPTIRGVKLVQSYQSIGIDLYRPTIRAAMEKEMKLVSEGAKSKEIVLRQNIAQMRMLFEKIQEKSDMMVNYLKANMYTESAQDLNEQIKERLNQNIPYPPPQAYEEEKRQQHPSGENNQSSKNSQVVTHLSKCTQCQTGKLSLKVSNTRTSLFFGCSTYPTCKNIVGIPKGMVKAQLLKKTCPQHPDVNLCKLTPSKKLKKEEVYALLGEKKHFCVLFCDKQVLSEFNKAGWNWQNEGVKFELCEIVGVPYKKPNQNVMSTSTMVFGQKRQLQNTGERSYSSSVQRRVDALNDNIIDWQQENIDSGRINQGRGRGRGKKRRGGGYNNNNNNRGGGYNNNNRGGGRGGYGRGGYGRGRGNNNSNNNYNMPWQFSWEFNIFGNLGDQISLISLMNESNLDIQLLYGIPKHFFK